MRRRIVKVLTWAPFLLVGAVLGYLVAQCERNRRPPPEPPAREQGGPPRVARR